MEQFLAFSFRLGGPPSGHVLGALPQGTRGLLWRRRFLFFGFVGALEELRVDAPGAR